MLAGSIMLWAVTDVFFGTLWNVMWRNVWRSYKHIDKEVHTVKTFCLKDTEGTKGEECWGSVGRFWRPPRRWRTVTHIINNLLCCTSGCFFVRLWSEGQPSALFWSINFNTLTFEALPSIFDHAGRFEVQQFGDPDVIEDKAVPLRANSGMERIWVQHTVPNKKGKQKPVKSKFCNWTF